MDLIPHDHFLPHLIAIYGNIKLPHAEKQMPGWRRVRFKLSDNPSELERGHVVRLGDVCQVQADNMSALLINSVNPIRWRPPLPPLIRRNVPQA